MDESNRNTSLPTVSRQHCDTKVGKRIRAIRKDKGYSQQKVADAADISTAHLSRVEKGASEEGGRQPSLSLINRFAVVLETTPEYLAWGRKTTHRTKREEHILTVFGNVTNSELHSLEAALEAMRCEA